MPISDLDLFRGLVDRVLRPVGQEAAVSADMELIQYINEAIELRRADPGDDLLSALIHLEDEGDRLDHFELMSHPDQQKMLVSCPDLMDTAIEEMVRFNGPVETPFPRFAYENVKFGDVTIPVGDTVVPVLLAANRYPDHFDEPDTFDITRDPNKHLAFGFGVHCCLGAPLARLEAKSAIGQLLERAPEVWMAIDRDDLQWNPEFFLRGVRSIPVAG